MLQQNEVSNVVEKIHGTFSQQSRTRSTRLKPVLLTPNILHYKRKLLVWEPRSQRS